MAKNRDDAATVGDLQDLADAMKGGFAEALKDTLGKVIPAPAPKGDGGSGDGGSGDGGSGGSGDGGGEAKTDWGFSGKWWGTK
jgi:hypothetical protein